MTAKEALNITDNERVLKVTRDEIRIIVRALDFSLVEAENQKSRYIQRSVMSEYNDTVCKEFDGKINVLLNLKNDIDNGVKDL